MSKTVNISSPSQFNEVLQGSKLVVANCECLARLSDVLLLYPAMIMTLHHHECS